MRALQPRGFTLLEVLFAASTIAIVATSAFLLLSTGISVWKRIGRETDRIRHFGSLVEALRSDLANLVATDGNPAIVDGDLLLLRYATLPGSGLPPSGSDATVNRPTLMVVVFQRQSTADSDSVLCRVTIPITVRHMATSSWPALRDSLAAGVHASATVDDGVWRLSRFEEVSRLAWSIETEPQSPSLLGFRHLVGLPVGQTKRGLGQQTVSDDDTSGDRLFTIPFAAPPTEHKLATTRRY